MWHIPSSQLFWHTTAYNVKTRVAIFAAVEERKVPNMTYHVQVETLVTR